MDASSGLRSRWHGRKRLRRRDLPNGRRCWCLGWCAQWLPWLKAEFGWSEMTAKRFVQVYRAFKSNNLVDLAIDVSSLYLLAAPKTTPAVRERKPVSQKRTRAPLSRSTAADGPKGVRRRLHSIAGSTGRKTAMGRSRFASLCEMGGAPGAGANENTGGSGRTHGALAR
jgi:hypothetical protein